MYLSDVLVDVGVVEDELRIAHLWKNCMSLGGGVGEGGRGA